MPWYAIVGMVITFAVGIWAGWAKVKNTLKELAEALAVLAEATEDDNITREELKRIVEEFKDVVLSALKVVGK